MSEFYLPLGNCRMDIDGNIPSVGSAPLQRAKSLYRQIVPENIRRIYYRLREGRPFAYPARVTQSFDGIKAKFEVEGLKELLRVKSLSGEKKYIKEFLEVLQPSDVFWDVGAYVGVWSLLAARKNPNVEIYSFEPEPECFTALKNNLGINQLNNQIKALPIALDKFPRQASLSSCGREGRCASLQSKNGYQYHYPIHSYSVDEVIRLGWAEKPTIMKIDVEGAESLIIEGMKRQNRPDHLFVELHPGFLISNYQTTPVSVWNRILSLEYQPAGVWQRNSEVLVHFALK